MTIRHANLNDVPFVLGLVGDGARDGHYAASLKDPTQLTAFERSLQRVVTRGEMERFSERGIEVVKAVLVVSEADANERVGFLLATEKVAGSINEVVELYKCSIARAYRRNGHARKLLSHFIHGYPYDVSFFARCYPKSSFMIQLLHSLGFERTGLTPGGTALLELKPERPNNSLKRTDQSLRD